MQWIAAHQTSLTFTISQSLLKPMSIESVISSNHLILCHPLLSLPSIFPSIRVFSNQSTLPIRWPKYWSFSFSTRPSSESTMHKVAKVLEVQLQQQFFQWVFIGRFSSNEGLISLIWFDLIAAHGNLKSSPASQFESINSLALSLLYGPTLTSIHDYMALTR